MTGVIVSPILVSSTVWLWPAAVGDAILRHTATMAIARTAPATGPFSSVRSGTPVGSSRPPHVERRRNRIAVRCFLPAGRTGPMISRLQGPTPLFRFEGGLVTVWRNGVPAALGVV